MNTKSRLSIQKALTALLLGGALAASACGSGTATAMTAQSYQGALTSVQAQTASDASGSSQMTLHSDGSTLDYTVMHSVQNATAVQLRKGSVGEAGQVVLSLSGNNGTVNLSADQAADLQSGALFLTVASASFPDGEISAQLYSTGAGAMAQTGSAQLSAVLSGLQLVPAVSSSNSGKATLTLDKASGQLSYNISHNISGAIDASLGLAAPGLAGTAVATLATGMTAAQLSGQVQLTADQKLQALSGQLYVEVHSAGASVLRGQIVPDVVSSAGSVQAAVPFTTAMSAPVGVTTQAQGSVHFLLSSDLSRLSYRLSSTAQDAVSAAIVKPAALGGSATVVCALSSAMDHAQGTCTVKAAGSASDLLAADLLAGSLAARLSSQAQAQGELVGTITIPK